MNDVVIILSICVIILSVCFILFSIIYINITKELKVNDEIINDKLFNIQRNQDNLLQKVLLILCKEEGTDRFKEIILDDKYKIKYNIDVMLEEYKNTLSAFKKDKTINKISDKLDNISQQIAENNKAKSSSMMD